MLREDDRERADTAEVDADDLPSQFDALDAAIEALLALLTTSHVEAAPDPPLAAAPRGGLIGLIGRYSIRGSADIRQDVPVLPATQREATGELATHDSDWL